MNQFEDNAKATPPAGKVPAPSKGRMDGLYSGKQLKSAGKSIWWQCRRGLYPVATGAGLWVTAASLHDGHADWTWGLVVPFGAAAAGVMVKQARKWIFNPKEVWRAVWAGGALGVAASWTAAGTAAGVGMDTPMPLLGLIAFGGASVPWWFLNRPKTREKIAPVPVPQPALTAPPPVPQIAPPPPPHPHQVAWKGHVGAVGNGKSGGGRLSGSELVNPAVVLDHEGRDNGRVWTIDGGPEKHTYPDMRQALDQIKVTLDGPDIDSRLYLEPDREGYKGRGRLIVLDRNPLVQEILWKGPQLDPKTGLVPFAVYPDGSGWAYYILYRPRWGTPHDLVVGVTGSGKSTALRLIGGESICAGAVLLLGDPHGGGSFQEVVPKASRAFLNGDEIYAGMRGVDAAKQERLRILREVGERNLGPDFGHPIVHTMLDEASNEVVLGNKDVRDIILGVVQEGRKLWFKLTLSLQRPSGNAFDDDTDVREQLLGGNRLAYRVTSRETTRMITMGGLEGVEPHLLPASFDADGKIPTTGLGFIIGASQRELVSRTVNATEQAFEKFVPKAADFDARTGEAFQRGFEQAMEDIEAARNAEGADGDELPAVGSSRRGGSRDKRAKEAVASVTSIKEAEGGGARDAIFAALRSGPKTPAELAEMGVCGMSTAYRVLRKAAEKGDAVAVGDGSYGIAS